VGIGTTAPAATLEVNGAAQVDGNLTLSGNILSGTLPVIQAPNNGSSNFSAGLGALGPLTTGSSNTAVGDNALYLNTSGYENTATGTSALYSNTTGQGNTANGTFALSQNNGSQNTAMGVVVLNSNTTGNDNAAIGYYALENNSTGIFNTAGGATSNNIQIGNYGTAGDSGTIRIGIQGTQTSAFIAGIYGAATSANNAVPVLIDSTRNLGTISSSRRYKEDIQDMGDASSGLMRLPAGDLSIQEAVRRRVEAGAIRADRRGSGGRLSGSGDAVAGWAGGDSEIPGAGPHAAERTAETEGADPLP